MKNYDKILIVFILIIASFLRFYRIADYMTFLGDEGRDVLVAYNILHGDFTLLGPTASVGGFFLGPIYYYFMAPFLWLFNYNPVGPAVMVALFGISTVWLIYKVGKEFFGSSVGLVACGLYSISPLVIIYSKSSWNPNLMPFFSLLTFYLIYKSLEKNSIKLFLISGFLFGITIQLHYLALFLGIIIFAYILLHQYAYSRTNFFSRVTKKYFYIFLGFAVGWSPFLVFEVRHGFPNTINILNFIFNPQGPNVNGNFFDIINNVFFRVFGRLVLNFPPPEKLSVWTKTNIDLWGNFTLALAILSIVVLFFKCLRAYRARSLDFAKLSFLLLWFVFGVGLFGFYKKSIYDYYFGFMFPLPFLIVGFFLKNLWEKKAGKVLSIVILLIILWLNYLSPPFKQPANRQLNQIQEISRFVLEKSNNKPFNFALVGGGNSDHAYRYFFKIWNKDPVMIKTLTNDSKRKSVTDQLLVVCETPSLCEPLGDPAWEVAGFGRAEIANVWDVSVVKVFKLEHYKEK